MATAEFRSRRAGLGRGGGSGVEVVQQDHCHVGGRDRFGDAGHDDGSGEGQQA